jgi:DNA replication protein DnaC
MPPSFRQFSLAQQQKMYTGAGGRDSEDPAQRLHRPAVLARLGRIDVLVIDDWAMAPLNENERREVWEICEDRYQTRSTILTSQLPVSRWHEQIGDPTIADGYWPENATELPDRIEFTARGIKTIVTTQWEQESKKT